MKLDDIPKDRRHEFLEMYLNPFVFTDEDLVTEDDYNEASANSKCELFYFNLFDAGPVEASKLIRQLKEWCADDANAEAYDPRYLNLFGSFNPFENPITE